MGPPAVLVDQALLVPGPLGPFPLPLAGLPAHTRADLLGATPEVDLSLRISSLLAAGDQDEAWRLVLAYPQDADRITATLLTWSAREQARLGLPIAKGQLIPLAAPPGSDGAVATTVTLLAAAPGRWFGPLVVAGAGATFTTLDAPGLLVRPVLPALRLAGGATRSAVAGGAALLILALSRPPAGGWPVWLVDGCTGLAVAVDRDGLVSPQAMQARRQAAGAPAIEALLEGRRVDPALATAVVAYLLHERRRTRLASLLDLLRSGASSAGALRIAYDLTGGQLVGLR